jgi:4-diphosphocytidyl-2-C-methyl-D-erythritol kinase
LQLKSVSLRANAKINLALAIKYKRDDGYHEIESIFQEIDFFDQINIAQDTKISFKSNSTDLQHDQKNLCVRAAMLIQDKYDIPGVKIKLTKRIPVGAGLGGGSSDAAAVIKGIISVYSLRADHSDLLTAAAQLGSDVPFFLTGGTAYVTGRGEKIRPIRMNLDYYLVLVFPDIPISTVWAYKNLNLALTKNDYGYKFTGFKFQDLPPSQFRSEYYNDFETTVFAAYPDLKKIKELLNASGADYAAMSGSGSAMFAVFASRRDAKKASSALGREYNCIITRPAGW